jgi:hypothetical protein
MRPAYLLPAAALLLGAAPARGEPPPRVSVRLDYQRGPGGAACPAEELLRDEVARRMGYDPFDPGAAGRLVVVVAWQARRFEAQVDRYTPGGEKTWSEVYPGGARCALMFPSLASEISAVLEPAPPALPAAPAPPAAPELPAAQAPPVAAPELPAVRAPPQGEPARAAPPPPPRPGIFKGPAGIGRAVAFGLAGAGLVTGSALAVTASEKAGEAQRLEGMLQQSRSGGSSACNRSASSFKTECAQLLDIRQQQGTYTNAAAGLIGAAGVLGGAAIASIWLPRAPATPSVQLAATVSRSCTVLTIQGSW